MTDMSDIAFSQVTIEETDDPDVIKIHREKREIGVAVRTDRKWRTDVEDESLWQVGSPDAV